MTLKHISAMLKVVVLHHASQQLLQTMTMPFHCSRFLRLYSGSAVAHQRRRRSKRRVNYRIGWCRKSGAWVDQEWTAEVLRWSTKSAGEG